MTILKTRVSEMDRHTVILSSTVCLLPMRTVKLGEGHEGIESDRPVTHSLTLWGTFEPPGVVSVSDMMISHE